MNASDIMTVRVITAGPETPINELVSLMLTNRISAVPIVQDGALLGIVSEGDLIRRAETQTEPKRSRWLEIATSITTLAHDYAKSHGRRASEIMTTDVISVSPETPIADIATMLEKHHIKRVPVVAQGKLVGIVSRANLLQALASRLTPAEGDRSDDRTIRAKLFAELEKQKWAAMPNDANVVIENGVVHLWGIIQSEEERKAMIVAAENTPGVKQVVDHMGYRVYTGL